MTLLLAPFSWAQEGTNVPALMSLAARASLRAAVEKRQAEEWARQRGLPIRRKLPNGAILEIMALRNGVPVYYVTYGVEAADSLSADELWPGGSTGLNRMPNTPTLVSPAANAIELGTPTLTVRATDADATDTLQYKIVFIRNGTTVATFDQTIDTTGWNKPAYSSDEDAVLTVPSTRSLSPGTEQYQETLPSDTVRLQVKAVDRGGNEAVSAEIRVPPPSPPF
jgi:hypothetical protein